MTAQGRLSHKRVLVVDDEPGMARLITTHLERDGHALTTMNSGMDVLAAIDAGGQLDAYVLDVQMQPGQQHGLSLAKMLERRHPDATIFFVTGDPGLAALDEFDGRTVFGKPLDFAALRRAVAAGAAKAQA